MAMVANNGQGPGRSRAVFRALTAPSAGAATMTTLKNASDPKLEVTPGAAGGLTTSNQMAMTTATAFAPANARHNIAPTRLEGAEG